MKKKKLSKFQLVQQRRMRLEARSKAAAKKPALAAKKNAAATPAGAPIAAPVAAGPSPSAGPAASGCSAAAPHEAPLEMGALVRIMDDSAAWCGAAGLVTAAATSGLVKIALPKGEVVEVGASLVAKAADFMKSAPFSWKKWPSL